MKIKDFKDFVSKLKRETPAFVEKMESLAIPSMFKLTMSGDLISETKKWGLAQTTFAVRILYILDSMESDCVRNASTYILSFQDINGEIYDKEISRKTFHKRFVKSVLYRDRKYFLNIENKRAETRQSIACLLNLNKNQIYKSYEVVSDESKICSFVNNLDWNNPWAAASHINHRLFFLRFANELDNDQKKSTLKIYQKYINSYVIKFILNGSVKGISPSNIIGGIMKIIMGTKFFDEDETYVSKKYIDLCLDFINPLDACESFNAIYVLQNSIKYIKYRENEVYNYIFKSVENWRSNFFIPNIVHSPLIKTKVRLVIMGQDYLKGSMNLICTEQLCLFGEY